MTSGLRGWRRPVRQRHVVMVMGGTTLVWSAAVGIMAWQVLTHWQSLVSLRHQPVTLRLPTGMPGRAEITTPLFTRLDLKSRVAVPIDQVVSVQLMNKLNARTVIKAEVPVETSVTFDEDIPVSTEVEMKIPVVSWLPAMNVRVPVMFKVPVHLKVPINVRIPLALDVKVSGDVSQPLKVPVRTTLQLTVPVHAKLEAQVLNRADFNLVGLQAPFELRVEQAQVRVPLRDIGWSRFF